MLKLTVIIFAVLLTTTVQCDTDLSPFEGEWWQAYLYNSEYRLCEHHMVKAAGTNKCTCDGQETTFPLLETTYSGIFVLTHQFTATIVTNTEEATRDLGKSCTCELQTQKYALRKMNDNYFVLYEKYAYDASRFDVVPALFTKTPVPERELQAYARSIADIKDLPGAHSLKCNYQ